MTTTPKALPDLIVRLSDEADLCRNEGADDIARLLDEAVQALNALKPADHLASAGGVEDDWLPIALAQEDELCIVFWRDESHPVNPERYELDHLFEGAWYRHSENYEHYMMVGASLGPGPSEKAPYTHFKVLHAPGAQSALSKEREVADGLRAELEAVKRDAERYRWLRENADAAGQNEQTPMVVMTDEDGSITSLPGYYLTHFALDEAIDAAMTAAPALAGR